MSRRTGQPLTEVEQDQIRDGLFEAARPIVTERPDLAWHRYKGKVTAGQPNSSQGLAISVFETVRKLRSRDKILAAWMQEAGFQGNSRGGWQICVEAEADTALLNEPVPSQIDVLMRTEETLVTVECKFTEKGGGRCSQPNPLPRVNRDAVKQCNGKYELQTNPANGRAGWCALEEKGVRYWDYIPDVLRYERQVAMDPCAFSGGRYQWMRNLVVAKALADKLRLRPVFLLVYVDGPEFHMSRYIGGNDWQDTRDRSLRGSVPALSLSYQTMLNVAANICEQDDRAVVDRLKEFVAERINGAKGKLLR